MSRPLRADAARNRGALVAAARAVFGERGLDAPLDEIAKRAGVGNATLYRRFPTRRSLLAAVFADRMADNAAAAERALAEPDAWEGFRCYVLHAFALQATDRGLADLLTVRDPANPDLEVLRAEAYDGFAAIVARAHAAGVLRADFTADDLPLLLMANAGLVRRTADSAPRAWERVAAYLLDGLAHPSALPAPAPPSRTALLRSMVLSSAAR